MEIHFGVITNNDEVDQDTALINVKFWRSAWRDANFSYTGYTQKEIMDIGLVAGNMKIRYDPFYLFTSQTTNSLNSGPLNANRKYRQISLRSNANLEELKITRQIDPLDQSAAGQDHQKFNRKQS